MGHKCRDTNGGIARDVFIQDGATGWRCTAREAEGGGREETEGLVKAGAEVGEVTDGVVGGYGIVRGGKHACKFGTKGCEGAGVRKEEVDGVVHRYCCGVGASIHFSGA